MDKKINNFLLNRDLDYNPYLPQDEDFFDITKAELRIDYQKYRNKPEFSVVIPTFNRKESLKFVLATAFYQSYPKSKYEVVIIDDGSNDGAVEWVKKLRPGCNFKYIYWPRKDIKPGREHKKYAKFYNRVGPARNIGIKHSQGKIILFNDADILMSKSCLKKHSEFHSKNKNIIVRGFRMLLPRGFRPNLVNISDITLLKKISQPEIPRDAKKIYCRFYNLSEEGWQRVVTPNLSIKKKNIEKIGGFSRDFVFWGFEDVDLGYRLSRQLNLKLIWEDKIKVFHLYHPKEWGNKSRDAMVFKIGANILYNKYLDDEIIHIFTDIIQKKYWKKYVNFRH